MTKNEFRKFAIKHGVEARYSGKARKFYLHKVGKSEPINDIINERAAFCGLR